MAGCPGWVDIHTYILHATTYYIDILRFIICSLSACLEFWNGGAPRTFHRLDYTRTAALVTNAGLTLELVGRLNSAVNTRRKKKHAHPPTNTFTT